MPLPDYEYKGLMAQAWDVLRGDTSQWNDRFFYLEAIRKYGQPVLDVGCGTGRLLLDFLQQGIEIEGVDNSPEMLAICRYKAEKPGLKPVLYEQYMESLDLPRRYRTILVPSSSLQLVIEPEAVLRSLERLQAHLLPGGTLVASIMTIWKEGDPFESEWEKSAVRQEDGVTFRRVSWSRFDPASECEQTRDTYQRIVDGEVVAEEKHQRAPATRSYTQAQAQSLFEQAGFANVQVLGEFIFEPAKPDENVFVLTGQKTE